MPRAAQVPPVRRGGTLIADGRNRKQVPVDGTAPASAAEPESGVESVMVDVTGLPLRDLAVAGDGALARCLRRLAADLDRPGEAVAGFNSAL
jgi:FXSXX-COOH protein